MKLYDDFNNINNFKKWLNKIYSIESDQFHQCEIYPSKMIKYNIGPMTSRFISYYQLNDWSVLNNVNRDVLVDYYINQENMNKDIKEIMLDITNKDIEIPDITLNKSPHKHFSEYYDEETLKLVTSKRQNIFSINLNIKNFFK